MTRVRAEEAAAMDLRMGGLTAVARTHPLVFRTLCFGERDLVDLVMFGCRKPVCWRCKGYCPCKERAE